MHPDVAAIRKASAWNKIDAAMEVLAADINPGVVDSFRNPPVPFYEKDSRDLYRIEAVASLLTALADQTDPLAALPVDKDVKDSLIDEGYETIHDITEASDQELLAIEGIGHRTLDQIRGFAPYKASGEQAASKPVAVQERQPVAEPPVAGEPPSSAQGSEASTGTAVPETATAGGNPDGTALEAAGNDSPESDNVATDRNPPAASGAEAESAPEGTTDTAMAPDAPAPGPIVQDGERPVAPGAPAASEMGGAAPGTPSGGRGAPGDTSGGGKTPDTDGGPSSRTRRSR